jgi:uncharacterized protein (DUF1501 family)
MQPLTRRRFLKQANCAALGTSAVLNTLLNLRLANSLVAQETTADSKALVCIFLAGGVDSFNLLVPRDPEPYGAYAASRGGLASNGGVALPRESLLPLTAPLSGYGLHPSCSNIQAMVNGSGDFDGRRRLAFIANVGTLIEPTTKEQYNAWEGGSNTTLRVPRALFSHIDQIDQWQTAVPQGMSQLSGWAGRCADILHSRYNDTTASMSVSLGGNNLFQVGSAVQQFTLDAGGAPGFSGSGTSPEDPFEIKNAALRSTLDLHYTNLLTEAFARLTKQSDGAQQFFQSRFSSPAAELGQEIDDLFPDSLLAQRLKAIVRTIKIRSQLGLRRQTFFVQYGGWDHHINMLDSIAPMLATLDGAIGAFQRALDRLGLANDVVTFTASDFGRTLRSNGRGTDHAWGGNAMVFGGGIEGGRIFGRYPELALGGPDDLGRGGRFLPSTAVDQYYAEMLRWFGVAPGDMEYVLPNVANFWDPRAGTAPLGFIRG